MNTTITAISTAPGKGSVGIVRVSGPHVKAVAEQVLGFLPKIRMATVAPFRNAEQAIIDEGVVLYFEAPHSFTGEDVLELQGHGGSVVLQQVLEAVLKCSGVRLARAGEFSERAFLNDKLDLLQAEAIADLIDARSTQAAQAAMHSLQGAFSAHIEALQNQLLHLRSYVEAAMDFADEKIELWSDARLAEELTEALRALAHIQKLAQQGSVLREGLRIVIAGKPNVGKSSLLNALAGEEIGIVSDIPGTTRDILRNGISWQGVMFHFSDTAGLRETQDPIEQIGVARARAEVAQADHVLWVVDAAEWPLSETEIAFGQETFQKPLAILVNKIDQNPACTSAVFSAPPVIFISAKTGAGLEEVRAYLTRLSQTEETPGVFSARTRHLHALSQTHEILATAHTQFLEHAALELLAEELRQAQHILGEMTGQVTTDDLLGKIFSTFCVGK